MKMVFGERPSDEERWQRESHLPVYTAYEKFLSCASLTVRQSMKFNYS